MPNEKKKSDLGTAMRRMTRLAKLDFGEEELARVVAKAVSVLGYVEQLGELDTDGVEPTSHAVSMEVRLRDDVVRPFEAAKEIPADAPDSDGPYVQVPKVIESE